MTNFQRKKVNNIETANYGKYVVIAKNSQNAEIWHEILSPNDWKGLKSEARKLINFDKNLKSNSLSKKEHWSTTEKSARKF